MKKSIKKRSIIVSVTALFLVLITAFAGCRHNSDLHQARAEKMIRYLTHELNLTESQQAMLVQFKDDMIAKREAAQQEREKNVAVFMEELKKDKIDQERLMDIYTEHKPLMDETVSFVISSLADFHKTLTPEQKSVLIEKLESLDRWHAYFMD